MTRLTSRCVRGEHRRVATTRIALIMFPAGARIDRAGRKNRRVWLAAPAGACLSGERRSWQV